MSSPKDFHIDAIYPEPLSRLRRPINDHSTSAAHRRAVKKQLHRNGGAGRFRTQPVTFHEIKEVDEDNITETETTGSAGALFKSESDLKAKFELFYRSITTNNENNPVPVKQPLPPSKLAATTTDPKFLKDSNNTTAVEISSTELPTCLAVNEPSDTDTLESSSSSVDAVTKIIIAKSDMQTATTTATTTSSSALSTPVDIPFNPKSRPSL